MAAGLGALLALEREDRGGDLFACALLAVSLSFSSLGIPFAAAGRGARAHRPRASRREPGWSLIPIALYALWWLGWGQRGRRTTPRFDNLREPRATSSTGFASSIASLLGLATPRDEFRDRLARLGACRCCVVALVLAAVRLRRLGRVPRGLLVALAIALAFWALAGLNATIGREPDAGRYQYVGAILLLLIAAELLRGVRIPPAGVIARPRGRRPSPR